ncbi:MAG: TonB-dependent receptor [Spirochaetales bacterium]|nr:TonB-dependent receptor [Spirochaetales bacterium]
MRKTWLLPFLLYPGQVFSQPIVVEANRSREERGSTTGSTRIDLKARGESRTLTELLEREAGVRVNRYGGEGYLSTISIRGSNPNQVNVSLDGIPLSNAVRGEVNLEDYSLDGLSSIEIFRSGEEVGSAAGGSINLVSAGPEKGAGFRVKARGGSYKTAGLSGNAYGGSTVRYAGHLKAETSQQNFKFRSDNGTPVLNEWDDFDDIRKNAHYHNYFGNLHLSHSRPRSRFFFLNDFVWRKHGLPGPVPDQTEKTERILGRNTTGVGAETRGVGLENLLMVTRAYYTHTGEHLRDPRQEFSFKEPNARTRLQQFGFHLNPELLLPHNTLRFFAHGNYEIYNEERLDRHDRFVEKVPRKVREQYTFRLEDEIAFFKDRLIFLPGIEYQRTTDYFRSANRIDEIRLASGRLQNYAELERSRYIRRANGEKIKKNEQYILPPSASIHELTNERLTIKGVPVKTRSLEWSLRAGAYSGKRLPLFIETFGEKGTIIGNPDLQAEEATTVEAGSGISLKSNSLSGKLELTGYKRIIEDMILFVPNSRFTLRPENVDRAVIRGVELKAEMDFFSRLKLYSSYTYQLAINDSNISYLRGKYLPLRPMHESHSGLVYYNEYLSAGLDIIYVGAVFRDRTNEYPGYVEPRWIYGSHLSFHLLRKGSSNQAERYEPEEKLTLSLRVNNIQNRRMTDINGYPLPGRSAYVQLEYRFHDLSLAADGN